MPKISGNSTFPEDALDREALGRRVREVWIAWAKTQHEPKASWLLPWEELDERDREVDRQIGEAIASDVTRNHRAELDATLAVANALRRRAEAAEARVPWAAYLGLVVGAVCLAALVWLGLHVPAPVECPPPPEPVVCPPPVVCESSETPTQADGDALGYWVGDGIEGRRHPWPDASNYPAERFEDDCHDVCAVPEGYTAHPAPGRVLVMDPAHLVCVCLHPDSHGSAWAVARWIGWERVR
jgi:hypothetical protein